MYRTEKGGMGNERLQHQWVCIFGCIVHSARHCRIRLYLLKNTAAKDNRLL